MILGLGTDVIENARIAKILAKRGQRFLERIYTKTEIEYSMAQANPAQHLAARFAAKESLIKALGLGSEGVAPFWKDAEVAGREYGKKEMRLKGRAQALAKELGVKRIHLTLSHSETVSIAVVILEN